MALGARSVLASGVVAAFAEVNQVKCDVNGNQDGQVVSLSDGKYDRCMAVITPSSSKPLPILFYFHGGTGNAGGCGHHPLATLAEQGGFALVCAEGIQDILGTGGQWTIPEIITDATGTPCNESDSLEIPYMNNAVDWLAEQTLDGRKVYDTSRIFFSGCSMGSAFTGYISQCWKQAHPGDISAFATDATGLKVKGDGAILPSDMYDESYTWGECPDCQYFPFKPVGYSDSLGLKACIFDNLSDGAFYQTSVNLGKLWPTLGAGNTVETFLEGAGHHCQLTTYSYQDLVTCVDDGTGRLLNSPLPAVEV